MKTLATIRVQNGRLVETYEVQRDEDGEIFIQNAIDLGTSGPVDTMHIDRAALRPIALALLDAAHAADAEDATPVVVRFPTGIRVTGAAQ